MKRAVSSRGHLPGFVTVVSLGMALPGAALAQVMPGSVPGTTRDQIEVPPPPRDERKPEVSIDSSTAFGQDDCTLATSDIRLNLREIQFEGVGGAQLSPVLRGEIQGLQPSEEGDQPISVVCRIRDRINAELARAGYVARVQVPPQEVSSGTLKLVIVSGRVVEVRMRGNVGRFRAALDKRLEQIRQMEPFNRDEAVRILLEANEIPGLAVRLSLRNAGGAPGDLIADVEAKAETVLMLANVQNFGSRQLGREVATIRTEFYGLTGMADRTYVSLSNSLQWNEIHIGQIGHDFALDSQGLRLGARLSLAQSQPDIANLDLQSRSLIAGIELSQPILKTIASEVNIATGFEVINQATRVLTGAGKAPFTHDQIRVLYGRIDGSMRKLAANGTPVFTLDGQLELRQGTGLLGATRTGVIENNFAPSRFEGNARATVVRGEVNADVSLGSIFGVSGKVFGQWASKPLLNLEEFSIGNYTIGRGYDPGANGGDRALAARIEPRARLGRIGPIELTVSGFYDVVRLWNLDSTAGTEAKRTLASVGGGMRMVWRNQQTGDARAVLEVTYAKPLDKAVVADTRKPTSRVLVSLTTKVLPWGSR